MIFSRKASGMKAIMMASQSIQCGSQSAIIAGGMVVELNL